MNKLFVVSISCLIALFGVNLVIGQQAPQQQQGILNITHQFESMNNKCLLRILSYLQILIHNQLNKLSYFRFQCKFSVDASFFTFNLLLFIEIHSNLQWQKASIKCSLSSHSSALLINSKYYLIGCQLKDPLSLEST